MSNTIGNDALLDLLKADSKLDISNIDVLPDQEDQITIEVVNEWYVVTEKLIRVLANVLPSTMAQPINQLRYAGHHVLKFCTATSEQEEYKKSNLIEAFKHCKRAYYDALDLYVFHLVAVFRDKLAFLPESEANNLSGSLKQHLDKVNEARECASARVDYYSEVFKLMPEGLSLINQLNETMSRLGVTGDVLRERAVLAQENNNLKVQIEQKLKEGEQKFNRFAVLLTVAIVAATFFGLVFQGVATAFFTEATINFHVKEVPTIEYQFKR